MPQFEIAYSIDSGATWHVAGINPYALLPSTAGLPTSSGFTLSDLNGQLWTVDKAQSDDAVNIQPVGSPAPGWGRQVFFDVELICANRQLKMDPSLDRGVLFCRESNGGAWRPTVPVEFAQVASDRQMWWATTSKGQLLMSPMDPRAWHKPMGDDFESIREMSPDGSAPGHLVAVAQKQGIEYIVKIDTAGYVVDRILMNFSVYSISAEGGKLVVVAGDGGVYLFDGGVWQNVMPGCHGMSTRDGGSP